jgi:2-polyprenyl-3-methyl-5-hydroxy-6-metoxy-1,4-benzoquinol methylase
MTQKSHYDFELNLDHSSNVHRIEMGMIPSGAFVLDVGCHTGIMGEVLKEKKQARVIGIDMDSEALQIARDRLEGTLPLNIEEPGWADALVAEGFHDFDVILFGDVLEHTRMPERILDEAKKLLKPDGHIIVSVPNIAHWRIRFGLFFGKFIYTDSGILDKTHLRFFTRKSVLHLINNAGLEIIKSDVAGYALPHWLLRLLPGLFAVQIVLAAKPK